MYRSISNQLAAEAGITCRRGVIVVGAQVPITPPVRGAASGAPGRSAVDVREGRGLPAVVAGVKVPAVTERPPGVPSVVPPVGPLAVPAAGLGCQQVIPDEILVELRVLVLSVAALLVVIGLRRGGGGGRALPLEAGLRGRDRDGDWLTCLAGEPAPLPAEGADDPGCDTCRMEPVGASAPLPVALIVPPERLPDIPRVGQAKRVGVEVFILAFKPFRLVFFLSRHGGLQVDHLEFLLRQRLLQPLQVGFTSLQLRLDVLHAVQVHLRHFSVGKFIPPVFCEFLLFPHFDVHTGLLCHQPQSGNATVTEKGGRQLSCVFRDSQWSVSQFPDKHSGGKKIRLVILSRPLSDHLQLHTAKWQTLRVVRVMQTPTLPVR